MEHIIVIGHMPLEAGETALGNAPALGRDYLAANREEFLAIGRSIRNDDYATITYTSGTTSDPKGVVLTHRNYTANVEQSLSRIDIPPYYRTLIIPSRWITAFAHVVGFLYHDACGATVATVQVGATPMETLKNIPQNIREVQPHFLLSVPALAKNFRKKSSKAPYGPRGDSPRRSTSRSARHTHTTATGMAGARMAHRAWPPWDFRRAAVPQGAAGVRWPPRILRRGRCALLDAELQRFFYAIGIPMFQGYGLSEATPVISTNSPKHHWHRFGSSGKILIPLDLKILDEEGVARFPGARRGAEIVVRGENVMAGYWKNPGPRPKPCATGGSTRATWVTSRRMISLCAGTLQEPADDRLGRRENTAPKGWRRRSWTSRPLFIDQILIHNNQNPFTGPSWCRTAKPCCASWRPAEWPKTGGREAAAEIIGAEIDRYRGQGAYAGESSPNGGCRPDWQSWTSRSRNRTGFW